MKPIDEKAIIARFESCQTQEERRALSKEVMDADELLAAARDRRKFYNRLNRETERAIINAINDLTHDEVKRWKHGQKVYFGTSLDSISMGWDLKFIKATEKKIAKGDWCYIWEYQPKARRLWLCKPGKPCKYENVFPESFSLRDVRDHQISRTELAIRQ